MPKSPGFLGYTTLIGNQPSKWEQTKQALWDSNLNTPFRAFYNLMNSPTLAANPTEKDVADSFDAAGGMMVGGSVVPKPQNALNMGIRAFHGSPHDFDRFSMDKIGTGEGAQAYGHGLYFAENPKIAEFYKTNLGRNYILKETGQPIDWNNPEHVAAASVFVANGDRAKAIQANRAFPAYGVLSGDAANLLESGAVIPEVITQQPRMYEVEINADPNAFLDWDKPLSEQPEAVRKAIEATRGKLPPNAYDDLGGDYSLLYDPQNRPGQFLNTLEAIGGRPDTGEQLLKEAGIPGIKYLDAGSRGAGDGTRNYVVFDDKLISIVRKYGIAGASAMLGYNILQNATPAQAEELRKLEPTR